MSAFRRRLNHYAAFVLVVWLFAFGMAFAQTCNVHRHMPTDECCTSMQASAIRPDASNDLVLPAHWSQPWLASEPRIHPALLVQLPAIEVVRSGGIWDDSGQGIPIVFLRLAL